MFVGGPEASKRGEDKTVLELHLPDVQGFEEGGVCWGWHGGWFVKKRGGGGCVVLVEKKKGVR